MKLEWTPRLAAHGYIWRKTCPRAHAISLSPTARSLLRFSGRVFGQLLDVSILLPENRT